ncbi:flavodoxin domain-containing protein [Ovoidimarina sediminis]|uniref:flavodoxin domain-containing protein n=1 Tax=Ovoidimarina sediminis TaxID=3079856 RepID=UPI0029136FF4|nr:flavodoxin domain-containing protein [Rhodophyticola sp. MJ-SS7]MDU8944783.1 flavodoxin domain-containing protein [Rhodophyticola sp. MJ-SS7]
MTVLLLYASVEGHTAKIAHFVEQAVCDAGHGVRPVDIGEKKPEVDFEGIDRIIVAGSVHRKRHPAAFEKNLTDFREPLAAHPTLFLSVSLCAGFPEGRDEAQSYVDDLCARTGFQPDATLLVGGALQFDKYQDYEAWVVRFIAVGMKRHEELEEDRELTDWTEIETAVEAFLQT